MKIILFIILNILFYLLIHSINIFSILKLILIKFAQSLAIKIFQLIK